VKEIFMTSKEKAKLLFKQEQPSGSQSSIPEYELRALAERTKTARLRELRLAREAQLASGPEETSVVTEKLTLLKSQNNQDAGSLQRGGQRHFLHVCASCRETNFADQSFPRIIQSRLAPEVILAGGLDHPGAKPGLPGRLDRGTAPFLPTQPNVVLTIAGLLDLPR
jgi:hypothetical protein